MEKLDMNETIMETPYDKDLMEKACTVILPNTLSKEELKKFYLERMRNAPQGATVCLPNGMYRHYELFNEEVRLFMTLEDGVNVLELGTSYGASSVFLSMNANLVVTIDIFNPNQTQDEQYKKRWSETNIQYVMDGLKQMPNIIPIIGDTKMVVPCLKDDFFDFAFIDAGHTYKEVKSDTEAVYPKMKANGRIMFHDYYFSPQVMEWLSDKQKEDARSYAGIHKYVNEIAKPEHIQVVGLSGIVRKEHIHL